MSPSAQEGGLRMPAPGLGSRLEPGSILAHLQIRATGVLVAEGGVRHDL